MRRYKTLTLNHDHRRLGFESLENRQMLTASMCAPCDPIIDPTNNDPTISTTSSSATSSEQPETIELEGGVQVVTGTIERSNSAMFQLTTDVETEILISRGDEGFEEFYLVLATESLGSSAGISSIRGEFSATLAAGTYDLYVFDFLSRNGNVEFEVTTPERAAEFEEFADVPYIGRDFDWNLNSVNAPEVWAQGFTGDGALVAVVDTGVDYTHPDLDANIWTNPGEIAGDGIDNDGNGYIDDIHGYDFAFRDNDPSDRNGHGTHVAGTIAAERNGQGTTGVAYDATILPVKVLRDDGRGSPFAIAQGIRYAVDVGADIINLSLGGGVTRAVHSALQYALANDVLVVAASGNDAADRPGAPALFSSFLPNTLSVGAHDQFGNRSGFSNRVGNSQSIQIDAPGSRVASTYVGGGYRYLNGTSMAAPHVAGVAALTVSANPDITSLEIRNLLTIGATQPIEGSDSIGGVNAARTVARAFQFDAYTNRRFSARSEASEVMGITSVTQGFITAVATDSEVGAAIAGSSLNDSSIGETAKRQENSVDEPTIERLNIATVEALFRELADTTIDDHCEFGHPTTSRFDDCPTDETPESVNDDLTLNALAIHSVESQITSEHV